MSDPDEDLPPDDELRAALRDWDVEGAPAALGRRVLESYRERAHRRGRWRRLLTAPVRLPLPVTVALAVLLLVTGYVAGRGASRPLPPVPSPGLAAASERVAAFPLVTQTELAGFKPLDEVKVKVLRKEETHEN